MVLFSGKKSYTLTSNKRYHPETQLSWIFYGCLSNLISFHPFYFHSNLSDTQLSLSEWSCSWMGGGHETRLLCTGKNYFLTRVFYIKLFKYFTLTNWLAWASSSPIKYFHYILTLDNNPMAIWLRCTLSSTWCNLVLVFLINLDLS